MSPRRRNDDACDGSGVHVPFNDRRNIREATCPRCARVLTLTWNGELPVHGFTMSTVPAGLPGGTQ